MKRKLFPAGLILVGIAVSAFCSTTSEIDINDAIQRGLVSVTATSLGGSSEECVHLELLKNVASDFRVKIEPGLLLRTLDPSLQDILVTQSAIVDLEGHREGNTNLYGFCCQSLNSTPTEGDGFLMSEMAHPDLVKVAQFLSKHQYDSEIEQEAVWSISDSHQVASIYNENSDDPQNSLQELRELCADIRGIEVPFYNIDYGDILDTPFVDEPQHIEGELVYQLMSDGIADLKLFDPEGRLMVTFFEGELLTPAYYTQGFSFTATSMKRGTYRFAFFVDGEEVQSKDFIL